MSRGRGRRRYARSSSASGGAGCLLLLGAAAVLAVAVAVIQAVVWLFTTPIPYVALALGGLAYAIQRVRQQRLQKLYFDSAAYLAGLTRGPQRVLERLRDRAGSHPDALLLLAAYSSSSGRHDEALGYVNAASRAPQRAGEISGGQSLCFVGLLEPIWLGPGPSLAANLALVAAHLQVLSGHVQEALPVLEARVHEPHLAAALGALADAYAVSGDRDRAAATLQYRLPGVTGPEAQRALRYQLALLFDDLGAKRQALAELRQVLLLGEHNDAAARARQLETELADEQMRARALEASRRQRAIVDSDEAVLRETLAKMSLARGTKSRQNAVDAGLRRLQHPHMRERLLLEASRLEVQAVLEKVDGLKTAKAKQRNLFEALEQLRNDPVPDELQRREILMLEQALGELEAKA